MRNPTVRGARSASRTPHQRFGSATRPLQERFSRDDKIGLTYTPMHLSCRLASVPARRSARVRPASDGAPLFDPRISPKTKACLAGEFAPYWIRVARCHWHRMAKLRWKGLAFGAYNSGYRLDPSAVLAIGATAHLDAKPAGLVDRQSGRYTADHRLPPARAGDECAITELLAQRGPVAFL